MLDYISELRALARYCNFGATLEDMLRDRIVCGINNEKLQQHLLGKAKLTYKKALELAQSSEAAALNVKEPQKAGARPGKVELTWTAGGDSVHQVHKLASAPPTKGSPITCYRCGKQGHLATKCKFKDAVCNFCGKKGHLQRVCKSRGVQEKKGNSSKVCHVEEKNGEESRAEDKEYTMFSKSSKSKPIAVSVDIEGQEVTMEVDTGAALSIISEETLQQLWPDWQLTPTQVRLQSYSGEAIQVLGSKMVQVQYKHQVARLPLLVVKGAGPSPFGRNLLDWTGMKFTGCKAVVYMICCRSTVQYSERAWVH